MQDLPTTAADGQPEEAAPRTGGPNGRQVLSVAAALVICLAAFAAMVIAGDATTDADRPTVTTLQGTDTGLGGFPFCTVETRPNGDGQLLAVSLLNELTTLWVQVFYVDGTDEVLTLPLERGWAVANLPAQPLVERAVVYGTQERISYTAGCAWPPPTPETTAP